MNCYIGMDVGGTTGRVRIVDTNGAILSDTEGLGGTIPQLGYAGMETRLRALLLPTLSSAGLRPADCCGLCLSASGIDTPELRQDYIHILTDMGFRAADIQASNDCEMLLSLFEGPCIALISGTGSIAAGRSGKDGEVLRCGGWSHILSDDGSAASLGFAAMRTVLKHWDKQLSSPVLASLFEADPEICEPEKLVVWCHRHIMDKEQLARLALLAVQAAERGDACAEGLIEAAAEGLLAYTMTVAGRLQLTEESFPLLLWGGVLTGSPLLRTALIRRLKQACPGCKPMLLSSSALECAVQLAMGKPSEAAMTAL